jgi:nucleoside-diphosphate-sugar epimerase
VFEGDLLDPDLIDSFVSGADTLFHCAAELRHEHLMWDVNVEGTRGLLDAAGRHLLGCFLYLSSVGVMGRTKKGLIDEEGPCTPESLYEQSKWEAEKLVMENASIPKIICLRPTNVVARERPGALEIPMRGSLADRIRTFVQGKENVHVVHAENVASAAIHTSELPLKNPELFIVSSDHEPLNTLAGLWSSYVDVRTGSAVGSSPKLTTLPITIPFLLRRLIRRHGNRGDTVYSSKKLFSSGFTYPLDWTACIKDIVHQGPIDSGFGKEVRNGTSDPSDHRIL